jgi:hypothetical protein
MIAVEAEVVGVAVPEVGSRLAEIRVKDPDVSSAEKTDTSPESAPTRYWKSFISGSRRECFLK